MPQMAEASVIAIGASIHPAEIVIVIFTLQSWATVASRPVLLAEAANSATASTAISHGFGRYHRRKRAHYEQRGECEFNNLHFSSPCSSEGESSLLG